MLGIQYLERVGSPSDPLAEMYDSGDQLNLDREVFTVDLMNCLIDPYYDGVRLDLRLAYRVVSSMDQAAQMYRNLINEHVDAGQVLEAKRVVKYLEGLRILQYYLAEKGRESAQQNAEDPGVEPEVLEIILARFNEERFTGPHRGTDLPQFAPYSVHSMGSPGSQWVVGDVEVLIGEVEAIRELFDPNTMQMLEMFVGEYQTRAEEIMAEAVFPVQHPAGEVPEGPADGPDFVGAG